MYVDIYIYIYIDRERCYTRSRSGASWHATPMRGQGLISLSSLYYTILYTIYYILYTIYYILYTIYYILYTIYYILYVYLCTHFAE